MPVFVLVARPERYGTEYASLGGMTTATRILYRAADDDMLIGTASFAEQRETAELYRDNPGFGGAHLYRTALPAGARVLDLVETGLPGLLAALSIDPDAWLDGRPLDRLVVDYASELVELGYSWSRHPETYPVHTVTWTWLGDEDEPELDEIG